MKYYIIAGEASGDLHGSNLMNAIYRRDPQADIRFWGGDLMAAVGGTLVRHIRDLAYMGFVEVATHMGTVLGNISFCKKDILEFRPDVMVFIDYPGFNLKIAKFTHKHGIKNVHYISPQLWAWKKGRMPAMRRDLDALCYILPFERDFFAKNPFDGAVYVGHPLLDVAQSDYASESVNDRLIALLPGSRKQELRRMLPFMLRLAANHPEYHFSIAGMRLLGDEFYHQLASQILPGGLPSNVDIVYDATYRLLARSYAAVVCSGTATLETTLFRVPQVVCYQTNPLSAAIARPLIGKRIKYISLPNLIADAPVVCELIQEGVTQSRLEQEFVKITADTESRQAILDGYDRAISQMGGPGASSRTAEVIFKTIERK